MTKNDKKGLFIVLEGWEGTGKTTQINLLKKVLEDIMPANKEVILTREPGGTNISEEIRSLLISKKMCELTEMYLFAGARAEHVSGVIKPFVDEGNIVISDRFIGSSLVYQGYARGLGIDLIDRINGPAIGDYYPDLTIQLMIKPEIGLARKNLQVDEINKFELEDLSFHQKIYDGYELIAKLYPNIVMIDASASIEKIHYEILKKLLILIDKKVMIDKEWSKVKTSLTSRLYI